MRKLKLEELNRPSIEEYKKQKKIPVVVVLDDIRSAMNVGSIFRTADAFSIEKIYICGITAKPPHREITKTAIGATESVDWEYSKDIQKTLEYLKSEDYTLIGIEQTTNSSMLSHDSFNNKNKYALVLGNEVKGLSNSILPHIDQFIEIEQFGTKHSLNVAVCTGIILWEVKTVFS